MNLPIRDSIEDIIKGKFGYTFEQKVESISSGNLKDIQLYYTLIPNHLMFNKIPSVLAIQKTNLIDSTSKYDVYMTLVFPNKEDQVFAFEKLIYQFEKYSKKSKTSETVDKKGNPIRQEAILEFNTDDNPIKLIISGYTANNGKEFQLRIQYPMNKK